MKVKILSLNIFEGGLFWDNIVAFLERENPEILCLQEVFNGDEKQPMSFQSIVRFKSLLPKYHFYYSPELYEVKPHGKGDTGNAIFSRYPIVEKQATFLHGHHRRIMRPADEKDFSHYPKNVQHAVIAISQTNLHVFNMHGVWGADGWDNPARLTMSKILVAQIKDQDPAVLMGDFNVKPDTQTIANLEKHMTNLFKDELVSSFNMKHKTNPGYATAVVDMFFMSPSIKVIAKSVPDDDVSDHKPLLVTIDL